MRRSNLPCAISVPPAVTAAAAPCGIERTYHPSAWELDWAGKLSALVVDNQRAWNAACRSVYGTHTGAQTLEKLPASFMH